MKVIELNTRTPPLADLIRASRKGPLLLVRGGKAQAIIEKMDDKDLEDWKQEHSPEAIAEGNKGRADYRKGRFVRQEDLIRDLELELEHDPKLMARSEESRRQHRQGKSKTLEAVRDAHMRKAPHTKQT